MLQLSRDNMRLICGLYCIVVLCLGGTIGQENESSDIVYPEKENSSCILNNGKTGQCVHILDCPEADETTKTKFPKPPICGFQGRFPILCCTLEEPEKKEKIVVVPRTNFGKLCADTYGKYGATIPEDAIVGGWNVLGKQLPHMAALGYGTEDAISYRCGGSLISSKFILTAAHCTFSKEVGEVKFVRMGDLNLKNDTDNEFAQDLLVLRWINHPDYRAPLVYHDIALLELDKNVVENEWVTPACLPNNRDMVTYDWTVSGWGALGYGESQSDHLQRVDIYQIDIEECKKFYKNNTRRYPMGIIDDWQICAGDLGKDTCQGDSGGPLQISLISQSSYIRGNTIFGVTSFGKACGISASPGIYTRVSYYVPWIESVVFK